MQGRGRGGGGVFFVWEGGFETVGRVGGGVEGEEEGVYFIIVLGSGVNINGVGTMTSSITFWES